jgi:hypothetical protein
MAFTGTKSAILAALASLLLPDGAGNILAAQTPPQFDNSLKLATTNFVKNAGLQSSSWSIISTTGVLPVSVVGGTVQNINAGGAPIQDLPLTSLVTPGSRIEFVNSGSFTQTIAAQSPDSLYTTAGIASSIVLQPGDTLTVECQQSQFWVAVGGSASLYTSAQFAFLKSGSGYQKLPGGLIVQWQNATTPASGNGTFNFPIAFPNQCFHVYTTPINTGANCSSASVGTITNTQANYWTLTSTSGNAQISAALGFRVLAIGY